MNSKCYLWIFNNLSKYEFKNQSIEIKESIGRLLITEDSIDSPEIISKMENYYTQLTNSFYNNVIGYQNGLADKNITSADLDCYFISTSEGIVPIGYYRSSRPAEATSMVQRYLDECKQNIKTEKNKLIVGWQNKVEDISKKYGQIKDSKNPNLLKAILGAIIAVAIIMMVVLSLAKMEIVSFLTSINDTYIIEKTASKLPILSGAGKNEILVFMICLLLALTVAVALGLFVIKEFKLIKNKNTTNSVLKNILSYVTRMESGIVDNMNSCVEPLYVAARQGNATSIVLNKNTSVIDNIKKDIEIAACFVNKTEQERTGIKKVMLIVAIIVALLLPLTYTNVIPDLVETINVQNRSNTINSNSTDHTINIDNADIDVDETQEEADENINKTQTNTTDFSYARYQSSMINNPTYEIINNYGYDYRCAVPEHFIKDSDSETYYAPDDTAIMEIRAKNNTYNMTVQQALNEYIDEIGGTVTYSAKGDEWFAVSIEKDGIAYYMKGFVDHYIREFAFSFPSEYLDNYSSYIEYIEDNFKRTDG